MKIICNKNDLQKLVSLAQNCTSKSSTLPILSAVLLKALKNRLIITSTNLEVGFEASMAAKVEKEGGVAPPVKTILALLPSISDEYIILESQNNNLHITSKNSSTNLKCFPLAEFPLLPKIKLSTSFTLPAPLLTQSLKYTLAATAHTYIKPELASIYLFSRQKIPLTFVATDSFRLAEKKTTFPTPPFSLLLPQKSSQEIVRIFEEASQENIDIIFNTNQILFQTKIISFTSRLTEGKFPDYQDIIPTSFLTQVVIDKNQLINAIRLAGVFVNRLSEILITVNSKDNLLEVSSGNIDSGEHHASYPAKISGLDLETSFNYRYFLDALQYISDPKIFLGFNDPQRAVLIRGFENTTYLNLVMPMRRT